MSSVLSVSALQHPELIHPALWRGSRLARPHGNTLSTGFEALDQQLPGRGWPASSLIEFMLVQPGVGEMHLLRPVLAGLDTQRCIALVRPPYVPYFHCWLNWHLDAHRLLWISPKTLGDTLWTAEQVLKHNACAALLCWADQVRAPDLRRLHLMAQKSDTLFILLRTHTAAQQASAAPLRLMLAPISQGLQVSILKRQGPSADKPISLFFYPKVSYPTLSTSQSHASLDQSLPAHTSSGRMFSAVGG